MKKFISAILLATLLFGVLAFSACQTQKDTPENEEEVTIPQAGSDEPASDTELNSSEEVPASNTEDQN
ncbi:MAG: hypothetical protein PHD87_08660 [Candidatus Cloacimonetes bacterium]|nr:hypothetical protein [Candidatus Cloacimonadota bacterium]